MKKHFKRFFMSLIFVLFLCVSSNATVIQTEAASSYKIINVSDGKIKQVGNYYFKIIDSYNETVGVSKSKYGSYRSTYLPCRFATNGVSAYYLDYSSYWDEFWLTKAILSTNSEELVKVFSCNNANYYDLATAYGKNLYITKRDIDNDTIKTYVYNTSKKTYKLAKSNCNIVKKKKDYVIAENLYTTYYVPTPLTLYRLTSSGMSAVKKLTSNGKVIKTSGDYFYYSTYPNDVSYSFRNKMNVYKLKYNSTTPKKLASITAKGYSIFPVKIASSYMTYNIQNATKSVTYKYYFKTGKKVVLEKHYY